MKPGANRVAKIAFYFFFGVCICFFVEVKSRFRFTPSGAEDVNFPTVLFVIQNNKEKTSACVAATTITEPLGGNVTKIPGVNKKNRTNMYKNMKKFMILYKRYKK